jgi:hypothetical protein
MIENKYGAGHLKSAGGGGIVEMKTKRKSAKENKFCPKIPAQADLRKIKFAQTENVPPPPPAAHHFFNGMCLLSYKI